MASQPGAADAYAGLENPAYAALTSVHARFAQRSGRVLRYDPEVAAFLAVPTDATSADWQDVLELMPVGTLAATSVELATLPDALQVTMAFELVQMVGEQLHGVADDQALTLGAADVPEMLELVRLTEPGPFFARTIELGRYIGVRDHGALVAMAGERLHLDGWTEISAVCTAPGNQGRGLASRLMSTLIADVEARSERAFLHVLVTNASAIRLYERLGFRVREQQTMSVLTRVA